MENETSIRKLLEIYYSGFAQKQGWEEVIADDFRYTGGDMMQTAPTVGKAAYIEVIKRFSRVFQAMRVNQMIIESDRACVIGNYDYLFPNGAAINGNVAEIWTAENGKLTSLTIYFDTLTFDKNIPKPVS